MAYVLELEGGETLSFKTWKQSLELLGASVEFHPRAIIEAVFGTLPVSFELRDEGLFEYAPDFVEAGTLQAFFDFQVTELGPGAAPAGIARRIAFIEAQSERHGPNAPAHIVEFGNRLRENAQLAQAGREEALRQIVTLRSPTGRSCVDLLATMLCAAAYARAAGARLIDDQYEGVVDIHSMESIAQWLNWNFGGGLETYDGLGDPFAGWR